MPVRASGDDLEGDGGLAPELFPDGDEIGAAELGRHDGPGYLRLCSVARR